MTISEGAAEENNVTKKSCVSTANKNTARQDAIADAQQNEVCYLSEKSTSPVGGDYGYCHIRNEGCDWKKVQKLDYAAAFGTQIIAPFSRMVTVKTGVGTCENRMTLAGSEGTLSMCHTRNWVNDLGVSNERQAINKGDALGHTRDV